MRTGLLFALLGLFGLSALGIEPNSYRIVVSDIRDNNGNFDLTFKRVLPTGSSQTVTLLDNDGVATLAAVQLMTVEKVRKALFNHNLERQDPTLEQLFDKSEIDQMRLLRNYALKRVEKALKAMIDDGHAQAKIGARSEKTVKELYGEVLTQLYGPFPRHRLKLSEIEEQNKLVTDLAWAGGPYRASYLQDGTISSYDDIMLKDTKDPKSSFLSGALAYGMYRFKGGYSKSHVFVDGELANIFARYQQSMNGTGGEPKRHQ